VFQPALFGGLMMGVLSALPLVSVGNVCCCLWVVSGGLLAAFLLQQNQSMPITPVDGALVGLLAGVFGAFIVVAISIPINILVGPMEREMMRRFIELSDNMPPEFRAVFERYSRPSTVSGAFWVIQEFFALVFWVFLGAIFSTIGGLLGSLIFKKDLPPGTIDVTPTTSTPSSF